MIKNDKALTPAEATVISPTLPWWALAGEALSNATIGYLGTLFSMITLQGDTSQEHVKEANKVKEKSSTAAGYGKPAAEHTKNKNKPAKPEKGKNE